MSDNPTAPAPDRVPTKEKIIYGLAGITDMWSAYTINRLQLPIFTIAVGLSPTLVGIIMVIYRMWDGFSDPVFGWLSDNARTRWGRRRPFILIGGVLIGITLPLVFLVQKDWSQNIIVAWLVVTGIMLYTAHSCWNVPYQSLMLEMTPDSWERTNLSAVRTYFQQASSLVHGLLWFFITLPVFASASGELDTLFGTRVILTIMAAFSMVVGILPAFFLPRAVLQGCGEPGEDVDHCQFQTHLWKPPVPFPRGIFPALHRRHPLRFRTLHVRAVLSCHAGRRGAGGEAHRHRRRHCHHRRHSRRARRPVERPPLWQRQDLGDCRGSFRIRLTAVVGDVHAFRALSERHLQSALPVRWCGDLGDHPLHDR